MGSQGWPGRRRAPWDSRCSPGVMSSVDTATVPTPRVAGEAGATGHGDWRSEAFWTEDPPSRLERLLWRRAAIARKKWATQIRNQLIAVLDADPDVLALTAKEQLELARSIRAASRQVFKERKQKSFARNNAKAIAVGAGILVGFGLALIAAGRWSFSPLWRATLMTGLCEGLLVGAVYGLERLVGHYRPPQLPPPWAPKAHVYARALCYLVAGITSLTVVLTLSDRHHHLSAAAKYAISAPLGFLACVLGLLTAVAVESVSRLGSRPADPYPELLMGLLHALDSVRKALAKAERGCVLDTPTRVKVARRLEPPARALSGASLSPVLGAELSPEVIVALQSEGAKVAAWLRECQVQILWPSPDAAGAVQSKLAAGLLAATRGQWETIQADPKPAPAPSWGQRYLPRLALTLALLASAWLIPQLLGSAISAGARTTLTVTLAVTAFTALFAPSDAVSKVADQVSAASPSTSTRN
jgi:hypothetical protein